MDLPGPPWERSVRGPPSPCGSPGQGRGAHRARVCRGLPPTPRPRAGFHPGVSAFPPLIDRTPLGLGPTLATALNVSRLFTNPASKHAVLESWGCGPRPLRLAVSALAVMTETLGGSLGTRHRARTSPAGQRPEEDEGRRRWTHRRSPGGVRPARLRLQGRGHRRELRGPVVHAMSQRRGTLRSSTVFTRTRTRDTHRVEDAQFLTMKPPAGTSSESS